MTRRLLTSGALAALLASLSAQAFAAPAVSPEKNSRASVTLLKPLQLTVLQSLNFGTIAQTSAGTVVLNPNTDALTTTGGLTSLGDSHCAQFGGAASRLSLVFIQIPTTTVVLTRAGGTERMNVTNWTLQGGAIRLVTGPFEFRVGATLTVPKNQAEGTYVGTFNVTAQYY